MAIIHAFDTGRLTANETFLRGEGLAALLRRPVPVDFPAFAYVIEHAEGLIAIDTGLAENTPAPRRLRGFPPVPHTPPGADIASQMRGAGLDPLEVTKVVLTHLDWDHTGGLAHFPDAQVLVHRPELDFAATLPGRLRYRPSLWPAGFEPTVYDLDSEPLGPFLASRAVTRAGDLRVVPIPGHSPGQVGVILETGDRTLLFAADHMLRADWFEEDLAAGRHVMLGAFAKRQSRASSARIAEFVRDTGAVLLPAHDADVPERLRRIGRAEREQELLAVEDQLVADLH